MMKLAGLLFLTAILLTLVSGCEQDSSISVDPPSPPPITFNDDDTIVGITVGTSFVDFGVKAIVFEDGQVFAWKQRKQGEHTFVSYKIPPANRKQLLHEFTTRNFSKLPPKMHNNVTDGEEVWILQADAKSAHDVVNYMVQNEHFDAVRGLFETTVEPSLDKGEQLTARKLLDTVAKRVEEIESDTPKQRLATKWLNRIEQTMIASQMIKLEVEQQSPTPADSTAKRNGSQ